MTKIFKRRFFLVIIVFLFISISSCAENKAVVCEHGVDITISSSLAKYIVASEKLPSKHFDYDGVKVMFDSDKAACYFVQNDQYVLSDKFKEHLDTYEDIIVLSEVSQQNDTTYAKFGKDKLVLDEFDEFGNKQEFSKEYQIVCTDLDGTRYSYQYRTFVSKGKRYYIYRYSSNIGMSIEQSFMVIKHNEKENRLLLIPLPYDTLYEVSGSSLSLKALIEKDTYLDERYSKFSYPKYLEGLEEDEVIEKITSWYIKYCHGYINEDNQLIIRYLGNDFMVSFGYKDTGNTLNKPGFKLTYLG